jgi:hypothetical protein
MTLITIAKANELFAKEIAFKSVHGLVLLVQRECLKIAVEKRAIAKPDVSE